MDMDNTNKIDNSFQPDALIEATLMSESLQGHDVAHAILGELQRRFTVVGRLKKNINACKQRIQELNERNKQIEDYMFEHVDEIGIGGKLDTTR